ncbi:PQQ-dependent catabolism-associated CXXCW motif protein [Pseudomonas sp. 5P_3.1_Bac2]|uniref:PQQ-dependent catabolism-associated CXXCW motif protein n=1 Tax=Pseudomonas sp. 5P_3.1_Bac2 TaxID=2971617 RepID=UPI0021C9D305|nr:PQQ-dependent catabolism-associated CXXCW motif protein [Pseudomonas sp. 5P_3.1_Bac2]MCU1716822.1 PQQ-dependent catabolism-associated CXXCW motif protein [Pseudomonas sp. 5P_3.1_Bac2]
MAAPSWATPELFTAEGYRASHYRSPTPPSSEVAITLDTPALQQLLKQQAQVQLIDVYRRQWLHGQFIEDQIHQNLPGSHWLANTGDGELSAIWQDYFADNLSRLSQGNKAWPLVFYCRSDCWLGWNAVKRAHALGYSQLYWYRDGIDAWQQAGLPLVTAQPEPLTRD